MQCGYNLRGLSGDPVTCPECGFLNPRRKPPSVAYHIENRRRSLESSLGVSVIGQLGVGAAIILATTGLVWDALAAFAAGIGAFIWGGRSFKRKCGTLPGRMRVFSAYQLVMGAAVLVAVLAVLELTGLFIVPMPFLSPVWRARLSIAAIVLVPIASVIWASRILRKLARLAEYQSTVDEELEWRGRSRNERTHETNEKPNS